MDSQKNVLTVPIAIVVAGIIIAGAIFFSRESTTKEVLKLPVQPPASINDDIQLNAISANDHILGNPNASIVMVEFSDLECPFCKTFHKTMETLMDQYGKTGNVAWVFRHFPLDIHPRAPKEAEASECAFEQGGNDKFWAYINKLLEITPSNNQLDPTQLPIIAKNVSLDGVKLQTCLDSGKFTAKVKADYEDGVRAGVSGTPNTILILTKSVTASAEKRLTEINQTIMAQLPPGSQSVITLDSTKKKVGIGGAFQLPLMKEIIDLLLSGK